MDLLEKAKQKLKEQLASVEQKPVEQTPIKLESLKPPMAPKPVKKEEKTEPNEFKIDWLKVANSSDFKRAVYLALEGKTFRGKDADLENELNKKVQIFRDPDFSNLIKELEENFKNGFMKPSQIK